jgi:protein phosphatase
VNVEVGAKTDVGQVRDGNEDSYIVEAPLFAVADGMGGHLAGDVASSTAVKIIAEESAKVSSEKPESLSLLFHEANSAIWSRSQSDRSLRGMGTTCTAILLDQSRAHIAHVGDSRAYLLRDGDLTQLTEDHTLVSRMVREGRLDPHEAERHPQRSIITRALGVDSDVNVDIQSITLEDGDRLLLCSDGLSSMLDADTIKQALETEQNAQAAADRLVEVANDAGGEDNITVVVLDLRDEKRQARPGASSVVPAPRQSDGDASGPRRPETEPVRPGVRRRGRRAVIGLTAFVALVAAGGAGVRYLLDNSWFVGVNQAGAVTIYNGIPDEVAGLTLKKPQQTSNIALADLPTFQRQDLRQGIKVDSLQAATSAVANLRSLAQRYKRANRQPKPKPTTKKKS